MDNINSPHINMRSPDPFLTLSNLQLEHGHTSGKKSLLCDRFMNELSAVKRRLNF